MKGYRTIAFNIAMGVMFLLVAAGIIEPDPNQAEFVNMILDKANEAFAAITVGGNMFLRKITTTPLGEKV